MPMIISSTHTQKSQPYSWHNIRSSHGYFTDHNRDLSYSKPEDSPFVQPRTVIWSWKPESWSTCHLHMTWYSTMVDFAGYEYTTIVWYQVSFCLKRTPDVGKTRLYLTRRWSIMSSSCRLLAYGWPGCVVMISQTLLMLLVLVWPWT